MQTLARLQLDLELSQEEAGSLCSDGNFRGALRDLEDRLRLRRIPSTGERAREEDEDLAIQEVIQKRLGADIDERQELIRMRIETAARQKAAESEETAILKRMNELLEGYETASAEFKPFLRKAKRLFHHYLSILRTVVSDDAEFTDASGELEEVYHKYLDRALHLVDETSGSRERSARST
jgi:hypothetical protein